MVLCMLAVPILRGQGSVAGTVVNSVTGDPVSGATVELLIAGRKEPAARTITGVSGAFRFSELAAGEYAPTFDADHYFASHGERFQVTAAPQAVRLDGELEPITTLRGRVLDADGKPLAGVRLELFTRTGRQGITSFVSDKDGNYRSRELEPGAYFLLARPDHGLSHGPDSKQAPAEPKDKKLWAPTFYPNVTDATLADPIQATGGELNGYDIRLRSVPAFRIRGTVRDSRGNPAAGVPVTLRNADLWYLESFSRPDAEAVSGPGGVFEFSEIGPGNWRIFAEAKAGSEGPRGFAVSTVSRHDEDDVQIRMAEPFRLDGAIELAGAAEPGKISTVVLSPVDGPRRNQADASVKDKAFQLDRVYPGRYRVRPPQVAGYYLDRVRLGEQDVTGQVVDLAAGAAPLRLIYRSDSGSASGSVEDGAGATVVLFSKEQSYLAEDFLITTRCSVDGKFAADRVRPGEYAAMAFRRVERDLLLEPSFVQRITRGAVSVRVEPGRTASVELRVSAWPQ